jgi:hypothetical protein
VASDDPPEPEEYEDFEPLTAAELAEIRELTASASPLAPLVASEGRRGPGQPGSARVLAGESSSPAAAFGAGMVLDVLPACPGLALSADAAAGDDDSYTGVSNQELIGVLCAWERLEARIAARKLAAVAEWCRRSPADGCEAQGPARMPEECDEFAADELAAALAGSRAAAAGLLDLARDLAVKLPGTSHSKRAGPGPPPGFGFTPARRDGPPGGYGTRRLRTPGRRGLIVALDPVTTQDCDHRFRARGHDPGVRLRHLTQVRYATCTGPGCRRPAAQSGFEHNIPYQAGGRTCLCNGGPSCKR